VCWVSLRDFVSPFYLLLCADLQLYEKQDLTNVLFLTFYYAIVYPAGFFWASATLTVHYWVDKFCLLRNWAPAPKLWTKIAELSRLYFFSGSLVAYALMSSYNFASFPYDNACDLDETASSEYVGTFSATRADGKPVNITIYDGDSVFKYCNQDMLRYKPWPAFPAIPSSQPKGGEWMSHGQEFTVIFGWTSVVVVIGVFATFANDMRKRLKLLLYGGFVSLDKASSKGFSELKDIYGYIPQSKINGALFPTLLCDISKIREDLIDWEDSADPGKKSHNAIYDVPGLVADNELDGVFSIVRQWTSAKKG